MSSVSPSNTPAGGNARPVVVHHHLRTRGRVCRKLPPIGDDSRNIAFFGHSMGGLVSFEVARRPSRAGHGIGRCSCRRSPHRVVGFDYIPDTDRGLLDAASQMMGVNPEFLENEEFAARPPTLRGYGVDQQVRGVVPIDGVVPHLRVLRRSDDPVATRKVQPWAERTTAECDVTGVPGASSRTICRSWSNDIEERISQRLAEG